MSHPFKLPRFLYLNYLGFSFGLLGFFIALTPSLMPRPVEFMGVVAGLGFAVFYGLGVLASAVIRRYKLFVEPKRSNKDRAWRWLLVATPAVILVSSALAEQWQNEQHILLSQPPIEQFGVLVIVAIASIVFIILLLIGRGFARLYRYVRSLIARLPVPLPYLGAVIAVVIVGVITLEMLTGILQRTVVAAVRASHTARDEHIDPAYSRPVSLFRSGGRESESSWEGLGAQGRRFVAEGPTRHDIEKFTKSSAKDPIRIYTGVKNAESREERVALAMRELDRTGAFDRKVIMVVTPTGTGWIEGESLSAFEFMHNGDTAAVSAQYSYLPSGWSFLLDRGEATAMGRALFEAVEQRIKKLPADERPKLVAYGLSLGSFGGQAGFASEQDFATRLDGALFVGTPGFSEPWRTLTRERDRGSPQIMPRYNNEQVIKFANETQDVINDIDARYKVLYFQYATDPFVWWDASLLYRKPDWMREAPGRGVSSALQWAPVITFVQVAIDQIFSLTMPGDYGHDYSHDTVASMAAVTKPSGWSAEKSRMLQEVINAGHFLQQE